MFFAVCLEFVRRKCLYSIIYRSMMIQINVNDVSMTSHDENTLRKNLWFVIKDFWLYWMTICTVLEPFLRISPSSLWTITSKRWCKYLFDIFLFHILSFSVFKSRWWINQWIGYFHSIIGKFIFIYRHMTFLALLCRTHKIFARNWITVIKLYSNKWNQLYWHHLTMC